MDDNRAFALFGDTAVQQITDKMPAACRCTGFHPDVIFGQGDIPDSYRFPGSAAYGDIRSLPPHGAAVFHHRPII